MSLVYRNQLSQLCSITKEILLPSPFSLLIEDYDNFKNQSPESTQALIDEIDLTTQEITKILNDLKMAHDSWQNLRISMTETERATDSQILEKFLQETDYIKIMYDLKRYLRKLRNSRHEVESNLPKTKPQFDHSHLLPELPLLNPSQNRPFNGNTQDSLKPVYTNTSDKSYRNRTLSNFCSYPNPSITEESDEKLANIPTPSIKSYIKDMNKLDPIPIPPGFSPLEEINVVENPNDLNNQMSEEIVLDKRITNEIINKRPISPPPGFTPIDEVCIIRNICKEFTPLKETINEDNEAKAYNYSKEMPLVLTNNSIPDLFPERPLISLENLQQSISPVNFNFSFGTTNINSSETDYILTSEEILEENKPLPPTLNYLEIFCIEKGKESPIPRKRQRKKLPKQLNREPTIINNSRSDVIACQIHLKRLKISPRNNRKYCINPFKFNAILNGFKQIHDQNPCSPLPSLKMSRIKGNESLTPKNLFSTLANLNLSEIQCVHHSVINWKEILSKIKQHDTLMHIIY
ncbi:unnamed protein product [Meloidogyne enterolobii]|uniref:Uncharacterized protein n=1 Tax=Meloidogyne enterolobii TaxID=390850 RepID=A0ACB0YQM0_MELEN